MGFRDRALELDLGESPWSRSARLVGPLFRWAGGKQRFLWHNKNLLPSFTGRYFEPFAGGLSVYFHYVQNSAKPFSAVIGDTNLRLIRCYKEVAADPEGVADRLEALAAAYAVSADKDSFYYDVREQHNRISPRSDAARFIFLMAAGWNGVYRSNTRGEFNVPHGSVKSLRIPDRDQLNAVALVFQLADIRARSWEGTINTAKPGDFIFFDPPYLTENRRDLYERGNQFGHDDHAKLADALSSLQSRGVDFLLTNGFERELEQMYRDLGLRVTTIDVQRSISGNVEGRETQYELVVTPNNSWDENIQNELALKLRIKNMNQRNGRGNDIQRP